MKRNTSLDTQQSDGFWYDRGQCDGADPSNGRTMARDLQRQGREPVNYAL
jgi:hypothetical protein